MSDINDAELHEIVQRVIHQVMGNSTRESVASASPTRTEVSGRKVVAIGADHGGFELKEVASGWRFQVREGLAPWVNRLWEEKPQKYSRALLETLALIAYRQPITRGEIEDIRGVSVSSQIMRTLLDRGWVKVVGHKEVPGRPGLYATTKEFLDYFGLKHLNLKRSIIAYVPYIFNCFSVLLFI